MRSDETMVLTKLPRLVSNETSKRRRAFENEKRQQDYNQSEKWFDKDTWRSVLANTDYARVEVLRPEQQKRVLANNNELTRRVPEEPKWNVDFKLSQTKELSPTRKNLLGN